MSSQNNHATRYWRIPELYNLELVRGINIAHFFPRHFHEVYTICVVEKSYRVCRHKGNSYIIPAGSIMLLNPGEVHSCGSGDDGCSYRVISPNTALVSSTVLDNDAVPGPILKSS